MRRGESILKEQRRHLLTSPSPGSRDLEDLEACEQDAEHAHARIEELVHAGEDSESRHLGLQLLSLTFPSQ